MKLIRQPDNPTTRQPDLELHVRRNCFPRDISQWLRANNVSSGRAGGHCVRATFVIRVGASDIACTQDIIIENMYVITS